jgi:hypothetical protein
MDLMGVVGLVVGVVGLAFAVLQYIDQRHEEQRAEEAERHLQEIGEKLRASEQHEQAIRAELMTANERLVELADKSLTVAANRFPYNLETLAEFIDAAKTEMAIMCDFIGYAVYSNPSGFHRYLAALDRAVKRNVEIRLVLYGLDTARQAIGRQFPVSTYLEERDSGRCREYYEHFHAGQEIPTSYNEFRDDLLRDEERLVTTLKGVQIKVTDHSFLAFAWVADQTIASVFAFRNDGEDEGGMTFRTRDTYITSDFRNVFQSEWDRAADPLYKGRW